MSDKMTVEQAKNWLTEDLIYALRCDGFEVTAKAIEAILNELARLQAINK